MSTKCLTPFMVENQHTGERSIPVPCGKCKPCKTRRASGWSFRLMQQEKVSLGSLFLTLTYDTKHVPLTPKGFMTLDKTDVQKWLKRLRKINPHEIKYYCAGEYGTKSMRPHYHLIIYNAEINCIEKTWKKGDIYYGGVTGASIGYVLKYMMKEPQIPLHQNDDRIKEFSNMSKKLGVNYISPKMEAWHKADLTNRVYVNGEGGKKICMPRYYKQKIYDELEAEAISIYNQSLQFERLHEHQSEWIKTHGENWEQIFKQYVISQKNQMYADAQKGRRI